MSGRPLTGALATLTSVTSATDLNTLLVSALKINEVRINQDTEFFDVSELSGSGSAVERVVGLAAGTFDFTGFYPKSAPRIGNSGFVSYSSGGYAEIVTKWSITVDFGEHDITAMTGAAVSAKVFMPSGIFSWSGSYTAHAVSGNAIVGPSSVNAAIATGTFKITEDGAADPALSGPVVVTGVNQMIRKADLQACEYTFQGAGALTETVGSTLPGLRKTTTGTWGTPDWDTDADGVPDVSVVLTTFTGRTITAAAFLKSITIECQMGQPVKVSGTCRYSGTVSRA